MFSDLFLILGAAVFSASLSEGLNWLLIYRTEEYQKLKGTVDRLQKKGTLIQCKILNN